MQKCELLTATELAERLQVKPETIRHWAARGIIPAIRISPKTLRFDLVAVLAEINARAAGESGGAQ